MATASDELGEYIANNLGFTAGTVAEVKDGVYNIIGIGTTKGIVTCSEQDKPYIDAMIELMPEDYDFKAIVKQGRQRSPRGKGFGDRAWRNNSQHKGIELSFAGKPDDTMRNILKSLGFRWSHLGGVWYLPNNKVDDPVRTFISNNAFTKVEDI